MLTSKPKPKRNNYSRRISKLFSVAKKRKFYVVWQGRQAGVFHDWASCEAQVKGFAGAKFKSFASLQEAQAALQAGYAQHISPKAPSATKQKQRTLSLPPEVALPSWAVDGACEGNPGVMEYRIVDTQSQQTIYHSEIFNKGTNNIAEFLALTKALQLKQSAQVAAIYTDSRTALAWLRHAKAKTTLANDASTQGLWQEISRAEQWLQRQDIPTLLTQVRKWQTTRWGEIPADFGRK